MNDCLQIFAPLLLVMEQMGFIVDKDEIVNIAPKFVLMFLHFRTF